MLLGVEVQGSFWGVGLNESTLIYFSHNAFDITQVYQHKTHNQMALEKLRFLEEPKGLFLEHRKCSFIIDLH